MNIRRPTDLRKKRDKRYTRQNIIIASVGVVFLLATIAFVVFIKQSSLFHIRTITVVGIPTDYGGQVQKDFEYFSREHSWMFRFFGANHMLAWDGNPEEFLNANPQFRLFRIQKDYVRRAIEITVDGREKFGVWCGVGLGDVSEENATSTVVATEEVSGSPNECFWFDREGVLFAKAPQVQSELFNRVYDSTGRALSLRDTILPDRLFGNLVKVFTILEVAQINTKTVFVRDLALEEADTNSLSDPRIMFSLRSDPTFSLSAINALKKSGEWSRLSYANFTVENRASYR